jgi:glycosyltransferase involved in cell wall biosynthesis
VTRVCIVNANLPPDSGGAELAAWRYAHRLRRSGSEAIMLAAVRAGSEIRTDLPEWVHTISEGDTGGSAVGRLLQHVPWTGVLRLAVRLWRRMASLHRKFDVVHIFNGRPVFNLLAVPAARFFGKPVIVEMSLVGSDDPLTLRGGTGEFGEALSSRLPVRFWLYRLADRYVTKSDPLTAAYALSGLPSEKLRYIPYGVSTTLFAPATDAERSEMRARLGLEVEGPVVLFVGGISPRKGVHTLLAAFRRVLRSHPDARLLLVGPASKYGTEYLNGLKADLSRWKLEPQVRLETGFRENVDEYMRAADVFVLPSEREGLPISILEAMASGLAVIASDIPEIAGSEIDPDREGLLVPAGDVGALAAALEAVISDPALGRRLGAAARARAEREFSDHVVDRSYLALYAELVKARNRFVPGKTEVVENTSTPKRMRGKA